MRRGMLIQQVARQLGDDPHTLIPELALLLYEDALAIANSLVNWPAGNGQALKKQQRLSALRKSPHSEERLAVVLYQQYQQAQKDRR